MTRIPESTIDANRPRRGVRVTRMEDAAGRYHYLAACGDCDWRYVATINAVVEEQARWHRSSHRSGHR